MFTGDRSGEWLYRALHDAGFANQAESTSRDDGLILTNAWVTAAVRCAPPANKPAPLERDNCASWLHDELDLLAFARVFLCLGQYGYHSLWRYLAAIGLDLPKPRPMFGHGVGIPLRDGRRVLLSYHPSQQNTFTGKLTRDMFDQVFAEARRLIEPGRRVP
jgi:uracil-DNA glycosylase